MIELKVTPERRAAYLNTTVCARITAWLDGHGHRALREGLPQHTQLAEDEYRTALRDLLPTGDMNTLIGELDALSVSIAKATAWRLEGTLRDFAPHDPVSVWYRFPVHEVDETLAGAKIKDLLLPHEKGSETAAEHREKEREKKVEALDDAVANANFGKPPTSAQAMTYMGLDPKEDRDRFGRILKAADRYERTRDTDTNQYIIKLKESF